MPLENKTKVLYLNPVAFPDYDQMFADAIAEYKSPLTDAYVASLNPATTPPKINNLEYRVYEAYTDLDVVRMARYCANNGFDAMIIGCFYDPSLKGAREISGDCTIVGPCQSACQAALTIADKFSIIIGRTKWEDQMRETVYGYGYHDQLASFQSVGLRVEEFHQDPAKTKELLLAAAIEAVEVHKAEAIVLGCTLEIGFFKILSEELEKHFGFYVPVIDPGIAAYKAAEEAANRAKIGWKTSRAWGYESPAEAEMKSFDIMQKDYEPGNLIHIPATK